MQVLRFVNTQRYTPTRVGKTWEAVPQNAQYIGTPPRVWGKLLKRSRTTWRYRYTPTRVGKTVYRFPRLGGGDRYTPTRVGKT